MTCQGDFIPHKRKERVLALVDRERELNQNFMRLLSTIPLMAHALGYEKDSVWISVAVIVIDQFSQFFSWVWESVVSSLVYLFTVPMTSTYFRPQTRELLSTLSSIVSKRMKYSDQVRKSLILVRKGDVVYTTAPFNLADFEQIIDRRFKRERKTPEPYSEEKFGKFTFCGEEMEFEEGASVLTHYIAGSRIDSIFKDDGSFYNFRNNEHLHFGIWKRAKDDTEDDEDADDSKGVPEDTNLVSEESRETEDSEETEVTKSSEQSEGKKLDSDDTDDDPEVNFNNFQDLLQIMEEMQMLPFIQTEDADCKHRFRSLDFNEFVLPGRSLKDLTFLVAKKSAIIGG
ncbi:hypothetical protein KC19_7G076800 [Ceratodon purpureus]|uniref:Uncharacterized protein n=1 Tax=Ceratodon purpureus TaxID=3225 RepID=A0A8T0H742_CERPU|nr:hypothetical protein KC19_7G076800 [Ceratodon purpureus]